MTDPGRFSPEDCNSGKVFVNRMVIGGLHATNGKSAPRDTLRLAKCCRRGGIFLTFFPTVLTFNQMVKHSSDTLDRVFSAVSDPTRRAILDKLALGESSVTELAEPHDMSLPAISKHLRVLEEAGLIAREKQGRVHRLQLEGKPMKDALDWIERYRKFWEEKFSALEKHLTSPKIR